MKLKGNIKKVLMGFISGVMALSMCMPSVSAFAAFTSGERATASPVQTIYPATFTVANSCTSVYKVVTDDGDYGYAMCAKSSGSGPKGSSYGSISVINSGTYTGDFQITVKVAPSQSTQVTIGSKYQVLQAAARAASDVGTGRGVSSDVYALLHMYASAIVSGDYTYIASSNNLDFQTDMKLKNQLREYVANTSTANSTLYKWTPDNNNEQVLVLRYEGQLEQVYSKFYIGKVKTSDNKTFVLTSGALFALYDENHNLVANFTDNGDGYYVVENVLLAKNVQSSFSRTFYYKELAAPPGCELDTTEYHITINYNFSNNSITYTEYHPNGTAVVGPITLNNWSGDNGIWKSTPIHLAPAIECRTSDAGLWINQSDNSMAFAFDIKKTTKDGSTPARGAKFTLYDADMNVSGSLTDTNNNGVYQSTALYLGQYTMATPYVSNHCFYEETSAATQYWDAQKNQWVNKTFYKDTNLYRFDAVYYPSSNEMHYSISIVNRNTGAVISYVINDAIIKNFTATWNRGGTVLVNEEYGSVKINKTDYNGTKISGASLSVYKSDGTLFKAMNTSETGVFTLDNIPNGTYYVQETKAPTGYQINPIKVAFAITKDNKVADLTGSPIKNPPLGTVTIYKVNKSGSPVTGATFTAYSDSTCKTSVGTLKETSTGSGIYKLTGLKFNDDLTAKTYYIKETAAPSGYNLDSKVYSFTISPSSPNATVGNSSNTNLSTLAKDGKFVELEYGSVTVQKVSTTGNKVSGAEFTVYRDANCTSIVNKLTESTTNPGTYSLGGLPLGDDYTSKTYYLKETKAPAGYMLDTKVYDFTISATNLNRTLDNTTNKNLGNFTEAGKFVEVEKGSVTIYKVNKSGSPVTGATFTVYSDSTCKTSLGTMTESAANKGTYTYKGLSLNSDYTAKTYYIKETAAPSGYQLDPNTYSFKISLDTRNVVVENTNIEALKGVTINGKFVELGFGSVKVNKISQDGNKLSGATFTVYSDSTCKTSVGTLTESSGVYSLGGLPLGNNFADKTYYLKETKAPSGYMLDPNVYAFTITKTDLDKIVDNTSFTTISDYTKVDQFVDISMGSITIVKVDADNVTTTVGGAEFAVYSDSSATNKFGDMVEVTTGYYTIENVPLNADLTAKTYYIKETKAPEGYILDTGIYSVTLSVNALNGIADNSSNANIVAYAKAGNFVEVKKGSVTLTKTDAYTGNKVSGAEFRVYNDEALTDEVGILSETSTGVYALGNLDLGKNMSYRTYYIAETKAANGYNKDPMVYSFTLSVNDRFKTVDNTSFAEIADYTKAGEFVQFPLATVKISKTGINGEALTGAEFRVYNNEECTEEVGILTEVNDGEYELEGLYLENNLSARTYYLKETAAPENFHLDPNVYSFVVDIDHNEVTVDNSKFATISLYAKDGKFVEIPYGSVEIYKVGINGEVLTGAEFKIYEDVDMTVELGSFTETTNGKYVYEGLKLNDDLSAKNYYVKEISCPEGYHLDPNVYSVTLSVEKLNSVLDNTSFTAISKYAADGKFVEIPLGNVNVEKYHETTEKLLAGCEFSVYNDKECTDLVGELKETSAGIYVLEDLMLNEDLSDRAYYLVETVAPEGCEIDPTVYEFILSVNDLNPAVGNKSDKKFYNDNPVTKTEITSEVGSAVAPVGEKQVFTDRVMYKSLIGGKEYEMVTTLYLMDKDGKEILDKDGNLTPLLDNEDNPIVVTTKFTPEGEGVVSGYVDCEITIDTTTLMGYSFFVYEDCYRDGKLVGFHHEVEDQTAFVPEIHTTLISKDTNSKLVPNTEEMTTLPDTVDYINLSNGKYVMVGALMDYDTGKPVIVDGKAVTAESAVFEINNDVNKGVNGSVVVEFTLPTVELADHTLVAFETLYAIKDDGSRVKIVEHNDITDVKQTGYVPSVKTQFYDRAFGLDSDMSSYGTNVSYEDKVSLTNVVPGTYTLRAKVMCKNTNEPLLDKEGNVQYATTTFTVTEEDCKEGPISCEKTVTFTGIDTTNLAGKTLVCFEYLERDGILIAVEANIENPDQTIRVPEAKTTLVENTTSTHTLVIAEEVVLKDTVAYSGLDTDREYEVVGHLYDVDTGKAVLDENGKEISAKATFKPTASEGTTEVTFKFKYDSIVTVTKVVAFEDVFDKETGVKVATHADLNDEAQQVKKALIKSLATVDGNKTFTQAEAVSITDINSYTNLCPGRNYTLIAQAYLVDDNGVATQFIVNGAGVSATGSFDASATGEGSTDCITLKFNAKNLPIGQRIVVYETLVDTATGAIVATEYDPSNAEQTVTLTKKPPVTRTGEEIDLTKPILAAGFLTLAISGLWIMRKINKNEIEILDEDREN